jgi:hypothetical protein
MDIGKIIPHDEFEAIMDANTPSATNVFATMLDLAGVVDTSLATDNQVITSAIRYIDLNGDLATDKVIFRNAGNTKDILTLSADGIAHSNPRGTTRSVAFGENAGAFTALGARCTNIGWGAGNSSTGDDSTAIGHDCGTSNTGINQVAIGDSTGKSNTGVHQNAIGEFAGWSNTGANNISIGERAGYGNDGERCTFIGRYAGHNNNSLGDDNVYIGHEAGTYVTDGTTPNQAGSESIFIGNNTRASAITETNQIGIGHNVIGNGSNTVTLGNTSIVNTYLNGNVQFRKGGFDGIFTHANTVDRTYTLQDDDGTFAFLTDIVPNTTFGSADITFTGARAHDTNGNNLTISTDGVTLADAYLYMSPGGAGGNTVTLYKAGQSVNLTNTSTELWYNDIAEFSISSVGTELAVLSTQKLGIWGATPIVQPAHIVDPTAMVAIVGSAPTAMAGITGAVVGDTIATNGGWGSSTEGGFDSMHVAIDANVVDRAAAKTAIDFNNAAIDLNITDIAALKTATDANKTAIDAILAWQAVTGLTAAS